MKNQSDRFYRSHFLLSSILAVLLGSSVLWLDVASGNSNDWGSGYYRLNPSMDRPFAPETNRETNGWYSDSDNYRNEEKPAQENRLYNNQRTYPRDLPDDFYLDPRSRDRQSRRGRPWGEIPPEWRNEDLNQRPLEERRLPSSRRRPSRYDDTPYDNNDPWQTPSDSEFDTWDYPYAPNRDYRRREYYPSSPYYNEDRSRDWRSRRRDPYDNYYYDGGNGWWDYP